jgi:hypothetical protein
MAKLSATIDHARTGPDVRATIIAVVSPGAPAPSLVAPRAGEDQAEQAQPTDDASAAAASAAVVGGSAV